MKIGALNTDSTLPTGLVWTPPSVTVGWSAVPQDGDVLGTDVWPVATIASAGAPAVTQADIGWPAAVVDGLKRFPPRYGSAGYTFSTGESAQPLMHVGHPTLVDSLGGPDTLEGVVTGSAVTVISGYTPATIYNNGAANLVIPQQAAAINVPVSCAMRFRVVGYGTGNEWVQHSINDTFRTRTSPSETLVFRVDGEEHFFSSAGTGWYSVLYHWAPSSAALGWTRRITVKGASADAAGVELQTNNAAADLALNSQMRVGSFWNGTAPADVEFRQWFGLWVGQEVAYADVFGVDDEPLDLAPDGTTGEGDRASVFINGLSGFQTGTNLGSLGTNASTNGVWS